MAWLFLLFMVIILVFIFIVTEVDLISPSFMLVVGYLIGVLCFLAINSMWGVHFGASVLILQVSGIVSFVVCAIFFQKIFEKSNNQIMESNISEVMIDNLHFLVLFSVAITFLQIINTAQMIQQMQHIIGSTNLTTVISSYRSNLIESSSSIRMSGLVTIFQKILTAFSFVLLFYFFYFINFSKNTIRVQKVLWLLLPSIMFIIQQLIMGGRLQLFRVMIMAFFLHYFLYGIKNGWTKDNLKKIVKVVIIIAVLCMPLFYGLKFMLGRSSNEGLLVYVFRYLGGSTGAFAEFINIGGEGSAKFGQETFMGIYDFVGRQLGENGLVTLPWATSPKGIAIGNVYGANRRFYADFGVVGIIVLNSLMGSFYGLYYGALKNINKYKILPIAITIYAYLFYAVFFQFEEGYFYFSIISVNTIVQIIFITIAFYITKILSNVRIV